MNAYKEKNPGVRKIKLSLTPILVFLLCLPEYRK